MESLLTLLFLCFGIVLCHLEHPLSKIKIHRAVVAIDHSVSVDAEFFTQDQALAHVRVSFTNLNASETDWIGVFSPANFSSNTCLEEGVKWIQAPKLCTTPVKYKMVNGTGNEVFRLVNQRADFVFALFRGLDNPVLVGMSKTVGFANPKAPLFPRLAQGHNWNEMTVTWTSGYSPAESKPIVLWGTHGGEETLITPGLTQTFTREDMCGAPARTVGWRDPGYIHFTTLTSLEPRTKYFYKIGNRLNNGQIIFGAENVFTSAPAPGEDSLQRVVIYGDLGKQDRDGSTQYNSFSFGALQTTDSLLKDIDNYDIVFHIGDIVYALGYICEWDQFIEQVSGISSRVPYMLASGNHERDWPNSGSFYTSTDSGGECGVPLQTLYNMPLKNPSKYWYKVDYGMFRFCVADTELDWREGSEQHKFLEECFAGVDRRRQPWLIFLAHRNLAYTSGVFQLGAYGEPMGRESLQKLWQKYKVDLGIYGHVHSYERTCPVYENNCVSNEKNFYSGTFNSTIHVTVGNAGTSLFGFVADPPRWSLVRDVDFGYSKLTAFNHSTLLFEYKRSKDDQIFDEFVISRNYRDVLGCDSRYISCPEFTLAN